MRICSRRTTKTDQRKTGESSYMFLLLCNSLILFTLDYRYLLFPEDRPVHVDNTMEYSSEEEEEEEMADSSEEEEEMADSSEEEEEAARVQKPARLGEEEETARLEEEEKDYRVPVSQYKVEVRRAFPSAKPVQEKVDELRRSGRQCKPTSRLIEEK